MRILKVDGKEADRRSLRAVLASAGHRVLVGAAGRRALATLQRRNEALAAKLKDHQAQLRLHRRELRAAAQRLKFSEDRLHALAGRLQQAREEESRRMAREIHDELGQALTSLSIDLVWLQAKIAREGSGEFAGQLRRRLESMTSLLERSVKSIQRIARELRPAMLDDLGLSATLEWQAEEFERRTAIPCRWSHTGSDVRPAPDQATALFRIFQESLTNVARHAHASSVTLSLRRLGPNVVLEIADDGQGFAPQALPGTNSLGLLGMRERAALVGARFTVSSAPGRGTRVRVILPLKHARNQRVTPNALAIPGS